MSEWPLLTQVRKLVGRRNWADDYDAVSAVEKQIDDLLHGMDEQWIDDRITELCQIWRSSLHSSDPLPFLRSRDASAIIQDVVHRSWDRGKHVIVGREEYCDVCHHDGTLNVIGHGYHDLQFAEPVARTLAALDAGHKLGLWPLKD